MDILCCLDPDEPMRPEQVGARVGWDDRYVGYHMRVLDRFNLVGRKRLRGDTSPTGYVLRIDREPDWVVELIKAHRSAD